MGDNLLLADPGMVIRSVGKCGYISVYLASEILKEVPLQIGQTLS